MALSARRRRLLSWAVVGKAAIVQGQGEGGAGDGGVRIVEQTAEYSNVGEPPADGFGIFSCDFNIVLKATVG